MGVSKPCYSLLQPSRLCIDGASSASSCRSSHSHRVQPSAVVHLQKEKEGAVPQCKGYTRLPSSARGICLPAALLSHQCGHCIPPWIRYSSPGSKLSWLLHIQCCVH